MSFLVSPNEGNPRAGDTAGRRRSCHSAPSVESLEGRQLLSHVAPRAGRPSAAIVIPPPFPEPQPPNPPTPRHATSLAIPYNAHPGPILNEVGLGFAVKSPRFYPYYTGAKRADLNAAGAKGVLDRSGNLVLTGIIAANGVNLTPTSAAEESFYTFGIDRGGAPAPGPIPGRPGITFDAIVTVSVRQTGVSAAVTDLNTGIVTPLSESSLVFKQNAVQVTVPSSVVASVGITGNRPARATFSASASPVTTDVQAIASFAPEFRGFRIANGAIPHRGR